MVLINRAPRLRAATAVLAATGALAAAALLPAARSASAAPGDLASATLVQLTNQDVPAIGLSAYRGAYGTARSTTVPDTDTADFSSDPDGMLSRISIATRTTQTSTSPSKYFAQAQLTNLVVWFNSSELIHYRPVEAGSVGSLDSYAECVPPPVGPYALAYNHTDGDEVTVLGHRVGVGTTRLQITGADIGLPATIGPSTLDVTVDQHADPAAQSRQYTAEAWLDVSISGTFTNLRGEQLYTGPVTDARLGEVHVTCPNTSPSPSPSPSPTPSPSPSPTASPTPTPTPTPTSTPTPTPSPTRPSPTPTRTPAPVPLPDTGADGRPLGLAAAALGLCALGVGALAYSRRRR
ncbi:hypothetical protein [Kitasatospora cineracea]|uniref:Gram-positive cocci surface proteins LPxTG domain-containing protein n=1 Tax=Kitasatospora cineracea TaxID=88074 RepID=A0A8G1UPZ8_9ACTN|nr:hypothetical protein [Kitasatospora cineracea]ROR45587.1 hypothetical protein EDD39_3828 [Kitasatospora cineracea]